MAHPRSGRADHLRDIFFGSRWIATLRDAHQHAVGDGCSVRQARRLADRAPFARELVRPLVITNIASARSPCAKIAVSLGYATGPARFDTVAKNAAVSKRAGPVAGIGPRGLLMCVIPLQRTLRRLSVRSTSPRQRPICPVQMKCGFSHPGLP